MTASESSGVTEADRPLLVYLHGFRSSPDSNKARITHQYAESRGLGGDLLMPYLREGPRASIRQLESLVAGRDSRRLGFFGSSLGGFYATVMAEKLGCPAVLINPAVRPSNYWHQYLGTFSNFYSGDTHQVTPEHVRELEELAPEELGDRQRYLVFLQRDDEVLNYRDALKLYGPERCVVRDTGSHAYEDFVEELPAAFDFLLSRITGKVR